jgi:SAM-dependent methyltransferase
VIDERAARIAALEYDYTSHQLEPVPTCNLCGSTHHVEVSRVDRYGYPAVFRVCARCGLGFISPRLSAADYARFYDGVYRPLVSAYHGRLIDAETVQVEQRDYAEELMGFLRAHLSAAPADVLDIGGSTGVIAAAARDAFGSEATVLDPAPDELAVAAAAGMETIEGFAEDYDGGDRRWRLVLLCQTIDHLLDIRSTLDAIRRVLADDGHAFVDVLDVEFMARRRGSVEGAVKIDHPYYLTRATACAYFDRAGLEVVAERMSGDGHWGFLLAPGEARDPDWAALERRAERLLGVFWQLRA